MVMKADTSSSGGEVSILGEERGREGEEEVLGEVEGG